MYLPMPRREATLAALQSSVNQIERLFLTASRRTG